MYVPHMSSHRDHLHKALVKDGFFLFWSGPFSQWHPSPFSIDGVRYTCAEQFMMSEKALLFKDHEARRRIMGSTDPAEQKRIGRSVRGFREPEWFRFARDIVRRGNVAKFSQDPELKDLLLETGTMTIVEASPHDRIWGIGMRKEDPRATVPSLWLGTNWLGEALMAVRAELSGASGG